MLKVLMLNNEFPPLGGGTATVTEAILKELATHNDIRIDLITSTIDQITHEQFSNAIEIHRLPIGMKNIHHATNVDLLNYTWKAFFKALSLTKQREYDVCFSWCTVPAGFLAMLLYHLKKIPYVVRISGPDLPGFEKRYQTTVRLLLPLLKHIWKNAGNTLVKCEYEKDILMSYVTESSIALIPNGVDIDIFNSSSTKSLRSESDYFHILSVGRLIQRKQHHILIQASEILKKNLPIRVTIVGAGDEFYSLQNLIVEMGLREVVTLKGAIERDEMPAIYQNADLFVHLSESEGMSVAILEACASGLPILCTSTGGIEHLIDQENGEILNSPTPEIVAEKIYHLLKSDQRPHMGTISRERAIHFQWEKIAADYKTLLTNVASTTIGGQRHSF